MCECKIVCLSYQKKSPEPITCSQCNENKIIIDVTTLNILAKHDGNQQISYSANECAESGTYGDVQLEKNQQYSTMSMFMMLYWLFCTECISSMCIQWNQFYYQYDTIEFWWECFKIWFFNCLFFFIILRSSAHTVYSAVSRQHIKHSMSNNCHVFIKHLWTRHYIWSYKPLVIWYSVPPSLSLRSARAVQQVFHGWWLNLKAIYKPFWPWFFISSEDHRLPCTK